MMGFAVGLLILFILLMCISGAVIGSLVIMGMEKDAKKKRGVVIGCVISLGIVFVVMSSLLVHIIMPCQATYVILWLVFPSFVAFLIVKRTEWYKKFGFADWPDLLPYIIIKSSERAVSEPEVALPKPVRRVAWERSKQREEQAQRENDSRREE